MCIGVGLRYAADAFRRTGVYAGVIPDAAVFSIAKTIFELKLLSGCDTERDSCIVRLSSGIRFGSAQTNASLYSGNSHVVGSETRFSLYTPKPLPQESAISVDGSHLRSRARLMSRANFESVGR